MKKVEVFDEENLIVIDDRFDTTDFTFYPEIKRFDISSSIKDDCFYNNQTIEYRIIASPICLEMRTLESSHEPPLEYSIKDGVVLESELKKKSSLFPDRIENLKKEVEWNKVPLFGNYEVNLYILSKHPEIIPKEDYRKFLRHSAERIKMGMFKLEEAVKGDNNDLQISSNDYGKHIWYSDNEENRKESEEYWKLPEEKRVKSGYNQKIEYVEKFKEAIFSEKSEKFCNISESEFYQSSEVLEYLESLLNKKGKISYKDEDKTEKVEMSSKSKGVVISLLLTLAISWFLSLFVDINPLTLFILIQVATFLQSVVGAWLGSLIE
jgi:hypothetical protein